MRQVPKRKISDIKKEIKTLKRKLGAARLNYKEAKEIQLELIKKIKEIKNKKINRAEAKRLEKEWYNSYDFLLQKALELNLKPGMYVIYGGGGMGGLEKKYCIHRVDKGKKGELKKFRIWLIGPDKTGWDHYWIGERGGPQMYPRKRYWYKKLDELKRYELELTKKIEEREKMKKEHESLPVIEGKEGEIKNVKAFAKIRSLLDDRVLVHAGIPIVLIEGESEKSIERRRKANKKLLSK